MRLKDELRGKLTAKQLEQLTGSFDIIGTIAKLEIVPALRKKERVIAEAVLRANPTVRTVVRKASAYGGKYRLQKVQVIAGEKTKETLHKESGVVVALDVEKCYFSVRSSSERLRIAGLVKPGEYVLVLFSGIGIFPLVIAKHSKAAHVWGVEFNPTAHAYGLLNVKRNKAANVTLLKGDVRTVVPKLKMKFDRIVMPLPMDAEQFLPLALKVCKRGGMVHLYGFLPENEIPAKAEEMVAVIAKKAKRPYKVVRVVKCGAYASRVYRVCMDIEVW